MKPEAWHKRIKRALGYYEARARLLEGRFERALRETDVFLIGHPRSGNTWLAYMLALLSFPERGGEITLANIRRFVPDASGRDHVIAAHGGLADPRIFRNHHPVYPERYRRVVYLARDPRAVLVSLWHYYRMVRSDPDTTLDRLVDEYLAHDHFDTWLRGLDRWDRHVSRFALDPEPRSEVLLVRYEDLVRDRSGELERLSGFLGIEPTSEALALAAERGSFAAMRLEEQRHGVEHLRRVRAPGGPFIRAGRTEGWRDELSDPARSRIELVLGPVMATLGYV